MGSKRDRGGAAQNRIQSKIDQLPKEIARAVKLMQSTIYDHINKNSYII
ncbi:MAG: hypothetical protein K0S25_1903 [Bacillus sp. (in: firmicutes)]|jgi:hypothetical protein|nr:hypothetical protein [Bacillus sp. (in: firmicutes)]